MAKKQIFLDPNVVENSKQRVANAESPSIIQEKLRPQVFPNAQMDTVVRNKLKNVHMDLDTEVKVIEVKTARMRRNIKSTFDSIMYEAIVEWLNNHYEEETTR